MDTSSTSQLIRDKQMMGNLMGASQFGLKARFINGFMNSSLEGSSDAPVRGKDGFDNFLEMLAQAQTQAEIKASEGREASEETAKNSAGRRSLNLLADASEMSRLMADDPSAGIKRSNLEDLLKSGRFGNLLGHQRGSRLQRPVKATAADELENNLKGGRGNFSPLRMLTAEEADNLSYGLFSPLRGGQSASLNGLGPDDDYWLDDPLKYPYKDLAEWPPGSSQIPSGQRAAKNSLAEAELLKTWALDRAETEKSIFSHVELDKLIEKVALSLDIDPRLVKAVIKTESNFNHKAVSRAGAKGLMQLMPGTARELGVQDPFNPVENVWAGARYLKKMLDRHGGNLNNALASYNWGPGNFDRKGKANMPGETRRYITTVNRHYARFKEV